GHLIAVAQQAKARYIRAGVDAVLHHGVPGGLVQGGHQFLCQSPPLDRQHLRLLCSGEDANADGLRQQQHVPRPGAGVGQHPVRMDEAGDRQAVLGLVVQDAVA
ncbi:DUF4190 domain-containing protein, partial [Dysosmobacter welbionis]